MAVAKREIISPEGLNLKEYVVSVKRVAIPRVVGRIPSHRLRPAFPSEMFS